MEQENLLIIFEEIKEQNQKQNLKIEELTQAVQELSKKFESQASDEAKAGNKKKIVIDADNFLSIIKRSIDYQNGLLNIGNTIYNNILLKFKAQHKYMVRMQPAKKFFRYLFIRRHVWMIFVVLFFICQSSFLLYETLYWHDKYKVNEENSLKFRYIMANGGCNKHTLYHFEDIFKVHRDEKAIHQLESWVNEYETNRNKRIDSLIQIQEKRKN